MECVIRNPKLFRFFTILTQVLTHGNGLIYSMNRATINLSIDHIISLFTFHPNVSNSFSDYY